VQLLIYIILNHIGWLCQYPQLTTMPLNQDLLSTLCVPHIKSTQLVPLSGTNKATLPYTPLETLPGINKATLPDT
jgi:hypothetical protein